MGYITIVGKKDQTFRILIQTAYVEEAVISSLEKVAEIWATLRV
jgi:hypothetical protein